MTGWLMRSLALLALALAGGGGLAQPLERLAPAETVLALGFRGGGEVDTSLLRELAALDFARAGDTLARLGQDEDAAALGDFLADPGAAVAALVEDCQELAALLRQEGAPLLGEEALLSVSISPFNPLPALTALVRLGEDQAAAASALQAALLDCARGEDGEGVLTLVQDGVPLYVLGDGGDMPVIVGSVDRLFFAGTNPDALRGVLRRAAGAAEPSWADRRLTTLASQSLSAQGFSLTLDIAALAEVLQGLSGFVASSETEPLLRRAFAALRTLGGVAGALSLTEEGILVEWLSASDPEGGDEALLELLRCPGCQLAEAPFAPEESVRVSGRILPLARLVDYLQGWLDDAAPLLGERLELRALALERGFDLDAALLAWWGETVYELGLEPLSSDLASLLYRPAQVLVVEVKSESAARAGLELWLEALPRWLGGLEGGLGSDLGAGLGTGLAGSLSESLRGRAAAPSPFAEIVREGYSEYGVQVERFRAGPTFDLAVAFVDGYLLVGSPSYALTQLLGARSAGAVGPAAYRAAARAAPGAVSGFHFRDDRVIVSSLADLGNLFSQPLAFALAAGLASELAEAFSSDAAEHDDAAPGEPFYQESPVDLTFAEPVDLALPVRLSGRLTQPSDVYALGTLEPGTRVTVTLESDDFDTFLYLIDADRGVYLDENDDVLGIRMSQLAFRAQADVRYWLEVTSYSGDAGGDYTLSLVSDGAAAHQEAPRPQTPSFADLLHLTELLPQALFVLADHLDTSEGYSELRPEGLYSRSLLRLVR